MGGFVYLVRAENGLCKIGVADNLTTRIRALWLFNAVDLELVHAIRSENPYELERRLHLQFIEAQVKGEWFGLGSEAVREITNIPGIDISPIDFKRIVALRRQTDAQGRPYLCYSCPHCGQGGRTKHWKTDFDIRCTFCAKTTTYSPQEAVFYEQI